jgi:hypothetical protein
MRVRTGRFVKLRSCAQPWEAERVEVGDGQHGIQALGRGSPPSAGVGRRLDGHEDRRSACSKFAEDRRASFPLLQLDGPEPVADPLVEVAENAGGLREAEVVAPAGQISSEVGDHVTHAPSTDPPGDVADPFLHDVKGAVRHPEPHRATRSYPERVAEDLTVRRQVDRALRLVDA